MITILSQDRTMLIRANKIEIRDAVIYANDEFIGTYSTETAANKVFEQIINHINKFERFLVGGTMKLSNYDIFEMPADEEV